MLKTLVLIVCIFLFLTGCGKISAYTSKNAVYDPAAKHVDRTHFKNWGSSDVFVGVAISGGGSRSANFSAAVLEELESHGFMDHVSAISSVSGGSITAAYFALHKDDLNWSEFYAKLRVDLEDRAWCRFLYCPWFSIANLFLGGFTHYDRSNLMAEVFDDVYFDNKTFGDLSSEGPKLLIIATSVTSPWITTPFLDLNFRTNLYSRLDTFPISQAVMASGAFPGVFHNVTLTNFDLHADSIEIADAHSLIHKMQTLSDSDRTRFFIQLPPNLDELSKLPSGSFLNNLLKGILIDFIYKDRTSPHETKKSLEGWFGSTIKFVPTYEHLYDGGPSDNWGLNTIMGAAQAFSEAKRERWKGCFVFLIDATSESLASDTRFEADTRQGLDYLVDSNLLEASDVLFNKSRLQMLTNLRKTEKGALHEGKLPQDETRSCMIWHIALVGLEESFGHKEGGLKKWSDTVPYAAKRIRTRYWLTGINGCSARQHQEILRAAAGILINGDGEHEISKLPEAHEWFHEHALGLKSYPRKSIFDEGPTELIVEDKTGLPSIRCLSFRK